MKKIDKGKQILSAYMNEIPENETWYQERMKSCLTCEYNTAVTGNGGVFDYLKSKTIGPKGSCKLCGCPVDRKAAVKSSVCALLEYENKPPKWNSLETLNPNDSAISVENLNPEVVTFQPTPDSTFVVSVDEVRPVVMFKIRMKCSHKLEIKNLEPSCGCFTPTLEMENDKTAVITFVMSTTGFKKGRNDRKLMIHYYKAPTKINTFTIDLHTTIG